MAVNSVIQLQKISKSFGRNIVLKDVSLKLEQGKFYALLGKNGAGKSTLMRIIMRYEQADAGEGWIFNKSLDDDADELNLQIGYVSEALDYLLPVKIEKLFSHFGGIYPKWDQGVFDNVLRHLRIDQTKYFRELSRGQKMQVALAAAIAIRPKLIVLDEITAVLDASARSYFMNYLGKFTKEGGTVLMATNIVSEVQHYADHMILIDEGRVKLDLPLSEVSKMFCKLRKQFGREHDVFKDDTCVEVGINSDKSTSYLISADRVQKYRFADEIYDNRGVTAEELFIYYTRGQTG
jgi:ABC-2 type transport system ATP-binding protein